MQTKISLLIIEIIRLVEFPFKIMYKYFLTNKTIQYKVDKLEKNICKAFIVHISWKKDRLKRKYDFKRHNYIYLHSVHCKCQAAFARFLLLYCLLLSLYTVILATCVTESIKLSCKADD